LTLNERFILHNEETITSFKYVLPSIKVEKSISYLKKAVTLLLELNYIIEEDYEIWQAKWKNIEDNLRPPTAI